MKVRILTASTAWGGLEVHAAGLARVLLARGHDVAIVQLGWNGFGERKATHDIQATVLQVPLSKPLKDMSWLNWCRVLSGMRGDVCVLTKGDFDVGSWQLDAAVRLFFRRYITIEQLATPMPLLQRGRHMGSTLPGLGLWWYRLLVARRFRSLWPHAVVCVSNAVREPLTRRYGFRPERLVTIHNGVAVAKFQADASVRARTRRGWGIPSGALVFGTVGRLHSRKGVAQTVELFHQLTRSLPGRDMWLVLAGDGPARGELEKQVQEKGLSARVLFTGYTDRAQDVYPAIDVFLMTSLNEGLPLALVEAMACGCCPIAMGCSGVPEVITDDTLGWLVPPGDAAGFLGAMNAAAAMSREQMALMGQRARHQALTRFDAETLLGVTADLIETTAGADRAGSPGPYVLDPSP